MNLELTPVSQRVARRFLADHHRHNLPPPGDLFRVGLSITGELRAIGIAGRPVNRVLDDGRTIEILRVCTMGDDNACYRLYGALCRAGRALGYLKAFTYTLASEPGTSPAAAGFTLDAVLDPRDSWSTPSRPRDQQEHRWIRSPL